MLRSLIVFGMALVVAACADSGGSDPESGVGTASRVTAEEQSPRASDRPAPATSAPRPVAVAFTVAEGKVSGPRRITVSLGDDVTFSVTSDVDDEVHVHTYDVTAALEAGRAATVRLRADIPGVFEVELEERHVLLTQLRVVP